MAKGRNKLSSNPVESHRKSERKKEIKKHKENQVQQKNSQLVNTELKKFDMLVGKYRKLEREGQLDEAGKEKLEKALKDRQKAIELKKEKGLLDPKLHSQSITNMNHLGKSENINESDSQFEDYGQNALGDLNLDDMSAEYSDSDYEDDEEENNESPHLDIEIEGEGKLSDIPTTQAESIMSNLKQPHISKSSNSISLPPLPPGPPPLSAKIIPKPVPLPPKIQQKAKVKAKANPPPPSHPVNIPFMPPPPPMRPPYQGTYPPPSYPPHFPPPPPIYSQPLHYPRPNRPTPPSAVSNSHYQSAPQLNSNTPKPTSTSNSASEKGSTSETSAAKLPVVISAEPELRDLRKELVTMVPATLKRKNITSKPNDNQLNTTSSAPSASSSQMKVFKPVINAAPNLSDDEDDNSTVSAPSKPTPSTQSTTQSKTQKDYEEFLKQMEGLL